MKRFVLNLSHNKEKHPRWSDVNCHRLICFEEKSQNILFLFQFYIFFNPSLKKMLLRRLRSGVDRSMSIGN